MTNNEFNPEWNAMAVMVEEQQRMAKRIEELETALAQPEPKPVGYFYNGRFSTEKNAPGIGTYGVPVYTAPPQREWVGLTDEEILIIYNTHTNANEWGYERAIEAKLKEKNNG